MSALPADDTAAIDSWIVVDLDRIGALPERLRRLWPADLLPRRTDESRTEEYGGAASGRDEGSEDGERAGGTRELDVLTAWLRGFAAELNRATTRISVVVSSGLETVHLALCLGPDIGHAILALQGEGLEDFAHHQLLRRLELDRIAHVVDDLTELVDRDCVLTLSWAAGSAATGTDATGLEFLRRKDGDWFRPVIDRDGGSITVDDDVAAGESAVRTLLSSVLTRTLNLGERAGAVRG